MPAFPLDTADPHALANAARAWVHSTLTPAARPDRTECVTCGAGLGQRCTTAAGRVTGWHSDRMMCRREADAAGLPYVTECAYRHTRHGLTVSTRGDDSTAPEDLVALRPLGGTRHAVGFRKDHPTAELRTRRIGTMLTNTLVVETLSKEGWRHILVDTADTALGSAPMPVLLGILLAADTRVQALTVIGRLFPDLMGLFARIHGAPDITDHNGCMRFGGYTEPYPGAWPEQAVLDMVGGDYSLIWPYLTTEAPL